MVLERKKHGKHVGNHVGFFIEESGTTLTLLGGNQSQQVKVSAGFHKSNLRGYRWPAWAPSSEHVRGW